MYKTVWTYIMRTLTHNGPFYCVYGRLRGLNGPGGEKNIESGKIVTSGAGKHFGDTKQCF